MAFVVRAGSSRGSGLYDLTRSATTTATETWPARSQFNRHPDRSRCARRRTASTIADTGKTILNRWKGQRRIGKGGHFLGRDHCGRFAIDRSERFQVSLGMAGWNTIDALTGGVHDAVAAADQPWCIASGDQIEKVRLVLPPIETALFAEDP